MSLCLLTRYFTYLDKCKDPKACTILLRGPSKDILHEIDRNLADAMYVARNMVFNPLLAPGGGATEMAISVELAKYAGQLMDGIEVGAVKAVADAFEVIPRTLIQNCGGNTIKTLTQLRARHANGEHVYGVDGYTGKVVNMKQYGLYESASVKIQIVKTAIEVRTIVLTSPLHCYCASMMSFPLNVWELMRARCQPHPVWQQLVATARQWLNYRIQIPVMSRSHTQYNLSNIFGNTIRNFISLSSARAEVDQPSYNGFMLLRKNRKVITGEVKSVGAALFPCIRHSQYRASGCA